MMQSPDAGEARLPSLSIWLGFFAMCIGMFMAILDVQIVATSLPTIQGALGINPDQMSWISDRLFDRRNRCDPADGLLDPLAQYALAFCIRHLAVYRRFRRMCTKR